MERTKLTVTVETVERERLEWMARETGRSLTALIRAILRRATLSGYADIAIRDGSSVETRGGS